MRIIVCNLLKCVYVSKYVCVRARACVYMCVYVCVCLRVCVCVLCVHVNFTESAWPE